MNRPNLPILLVAAAFVAGIAATLVLLRKEPFRNRLNSTCRRWTDDLRAEYLTRRYYQE